MKRQRKREKEKKKNTLQNLRVQSDEKRVFGQDCREVTGMFVEKGMKDRVGVKSVFAH